MIQTVKEEGQGPGNGSCQVCGQPVKVWVMQGYRKGRPVLGRFCMECADRLTWGAGLAGRRREKGRLSMASILIFTGLLVGILGIMWDYLGIGRLGTGAGGVGWHQQTGMVLGGLLIVLGAVFRIDLVVVVGGLGFGVSVFADTLGLTGGDGLGGKQQLVALVGLGLVFIGFGLSRIDAREKA